MVFLERWPPHHSIHFIFLLNWLHFSTGIHKNYLTLKNRKEKKNSLTVPEFIYVEVFYSYNLAFTEQAPWRPSEVKYLYLDPYLLITQYPQSIALWALVMICPHVRYLAPYSFLPNVVFFIVLTTHFPLLNITQTSIHTEWIWQFSSKILSGFFPLEKYQIELDFLTW